MYHLLLVFIYYFLFSYPPDFFLVFFLFWNFYFCHLEYVYSTCILSFPFMYYLLWVLYQYTLKIPTVSIRALALSHDLCKKKNIILTQVFTISCARPPRLMVWAFPGDHSLSVGRTTFNTSWTEQVWWQWALLTFPSHHNAFISPSFPRDNWYRIPRWLSFLSYGNLKSFVPCFCWLPWFLMTNAYVAIVFSLCVMCCEAFVLWLLSRFFPCFWLAGELRCLSPTLSCFISDEDIEEKPTRAIFLILLESRSLVILTDSLTLAWSIYLDSICAIQQDSLVAGTGK